MGGFTPILFPMGVEYIGFAHGRQPIDYFRGKGEVLMKVAVDYQGRTAIFTPEGPRILGSNVENLYLAYQASKERSPRVVVVDLEKVKLLDSVGLGSFISAKRIFGSSTRFLLCSLSKKVEETFRRTRLDLIFPIHANLKEAMASIPIRDKE